MYRIIGKQRVPQTIPNIKVSHHNEKIVDISFSILEILEKNPNKFSK